jgi:hypothetical protein
MLTAMSRTSSAATVEWLLIMLFLALLVRIVVW